MLSAEAIEAGICIELVNLISDHVVYPQKVSQLVILNH